MDIMCPKTRAKQQPDRLRTQASSSLVTSRRSPSSGEIRLQHRKAGAGPGRGWMERQMDRRRSHSSRRRYAGFVEDYAQQRLDAPEAGSAEQKRLAEGKG